MTDPVTLAVIQADPQQVRDEIPTPPTPIPSPQGGGEALAAPVPHLARRLARGASLPSCGGGMGWGGLFAAAAALTPIAAWAEVCDKMAPGGGAGMFLWFLPEIIVVLVAAAALWADSRIGLLAATVIAVACIALHMVGSAGEVQVLARAEGCAAPRFLAPSMFAALAALLLFRAFRKRRPARGAP